MSDITLPIGLPLLIEAMVRIGLSDGPGFLAMTKLAPDCGAPARYFEPFLQQMRTDGLLDGLRGPDGGYRLAKAPEDISIGDIYRAVRGYRQKRMGASTWLDGRLSNWPVSDLGRALLPQLERCDADMMAQLNAVSLADLIYGLYDLAGEERPVGGVQRATECRATEYC